MPASCYEANSSQLQTVLLVTYCCEVGIYVTYKERFFVGNQESICIRKKILYSWEELIFIIRSRRYLRITKTQPPIFCKNVWVYRRRNHAVFTETILNRDMFIWLGDGRVQAYLQYSSLCPCSQWRGHCHSPPAARGGLRLLFFRLHVVLPSQKVHTRNLRGTQSTGLQVCGMPLVQFRIVDNGEKKVVSYAATQTSLRLRNRVVI